MSIQYETKINGEQKQLLARGSSGHISGCWAKATVGAGLEEVAVGAVKRVTDCAFPPPRGRVSGLRQAFCVFTSQQGLPPVCH